MIVLCPLHLQIPGGADNIPTRLCKPVTMSWEAFQDQVFPLELQPARPMPGAVGAEADAKPKQLSFIRTRNRFQTVVTALQAGGNILSLLERLLQRLGISPVEAIATFLSILVALQLLIELYVCSNYQRPLLLKLDSEQLARLNEDAHWSMADLEASHGQNQKNASICAVLVYMLVSVPALYYFARYMHTHLISALSSLLFFLSQTLIVVANYSHATIAPVLSLCSPLVYGSSVIVAVVGTIVEWRAFHINPSLHNWFAWILPHVSS